jgi:hypothetical protein
MNAAARPEVLSEMDQGKAHYGNPRVDTVLEEFCSNEQASSRKPEGPHVPDENALETGIGGAGI